MIKVVLLIVSVLFSGCINDINIIESKKKPTKLATLCVNNVTYLVIHKPVGYHRYYGLTVMLDSNSSIMPCDTNNKKRTHL